MSGHINPSGSWKELKSAHCKVNGEWKEITSGYANDNGTWKEIFSSGGVYGFRIAVNESDPSSRVTYPETLFGKKNLNYGFNPLHKLFLFFLHMDLF